MSRSVTMDAPAPRTTVGESARVGVGILGATGYAGAELVRLLAEGGMGEVWEAQHLFTRRRVAVKVLQSSLSALPDMRRRLLREARAATSVGHPNVVDVFDVFELEDGSPVMVMAFLEGETLGSRLERDGRLELGDLANVLLPVISAVGFAHSRGVVHRDLKPENVFLSSDGSVKVLDFGIAKPIPEMWDASDSPPTAGVPLGTPAYMAPEQTGGGAGGAQAIDTRTDVYALGAVLYELVCGRPPNDITDGDPLESLRGIRDTVPPAASRPTIIDTPHRSGRLSLPVVPTRFAPAPALWPDPVP